MTNLIVKLEWDEEKLGPKWMNFDRLCFLLFSPERTYTNLVTVTDVTGLIEEVKANLGIPYLASPAPLGHAYDLLDIIIPDKTSTPRVQVEDSEDDEFEVAGNA